MKVILFGKSLELYIEGITVAGGNNTPCSFFTMPSKENMFHFFGRTDKYYHMENKHTVYPSWSKLLIQTACSPPLCSHYADTFFSPFKSRSSSGWDCLSWDDREWEHASVPWLTGLGRSRRGVQRGESGWEECGTPTTSSKVLT